MTEPGVDIAQTRTEDFFKPLGFGDLLERAFRICWQNAKSFVVVVAALVVPPNILFVVALALLPPEIFVQDPNNPILVDPTSIETERFLLPLILAAVALVTAMIGWAAANAAAFYIAAGAHVGQPVPLKRALKAGLRRLHSVLWVLILSGLLPFLAFALVFAPGLVSVLIVQDVSSFIVFFVMILLAVASAVTLWVLLALSIPTLVAEGTRGTTALRRSYRLVKSNFWWTAGVILVTAVAGWLVGSILSVPAGLGSMAFLGDNPALDLSVRTAANLLSIFVTIPLQITVTALVYIDARAREEGLTPEGVREELHNSLR
jgi:hypothetical protein